MHFALDVEDVSDRHEPQSHCVGLSDSLHDVSCASSVLVIASNLVDESQEAILFYILSCNESELSLFRHVVPS